MTETDGRPGIPAEEFAKAQDVIRKMGDYYSAKVVGQENLKKSLISAVLADGHILLESVPGLAKTTAAKAIADSVAGRFSRIQCTPDLLPGDIIGSQIYRQDTGKFETIFGPIFANFVLLDEINRSSAKTQSAMLEAMQERQVTIGGLTYRMPQDIFIVIATQNPIEQEGTYPLSEAQTDRFMIKEKIDYPSPEEEVQILDRIEADAFAKVPPVLTIRDIDDAQKTCEKVYADRSIKRYISLLVDATRHTDKILKAAHAAYVRMGASPRATISFLRMSKAYALMAGRDYVTPDDVKAVRCPVLRHRIALNYAAVADEVAVEEIIDEIAAKVPTP